MTVEAVVFDIGNVLIEWAPERFFDAQIGEARRKAFFEAVPILDMNDDVDRGVNFDTALTTLAKKYPDWQTEIALWHNNWIELASPAIEHSARLLRALRASGVPVFALSNFGVETFETACQYYPVLSEFDQSYISGHLGTIKPDPQIYEILDTACGVQPEKLLFTDDRADNIETARSRGWQVHLFEGPQGWADRLVAEGVLELEDAA